MRLASLPSAFLGLAAAIALSTPPALAAWAPYQVFSQPGTNQFGAKLTTDGSTGALVAWTDTRVSGSDVFVQHVTAADDPDPSWPSGGRLLASNSDNPAITTDGAGGAIVAWTTLGSHHIYAQHVLASGTLDPAWPSGGVLICSAPGGRSETHAVADGSGGLLLVWGDGRPASGGIYGHHVLATGIVDPAWPANGLAIVLATDVVLIVQVARPAAVTDSAGGMIVTWVDFRNGDYDIFAQRIQISGSTAPGWPAGGLAVRSAPGNQWNPVQCSDGAGGSIIEWTTDGASGTAGMRVRANGSFGSGWNHNGETVSTLGNVYAVVSDGGGGAISALISAKADVVYAQKISSSGTRAWGTDGVAVRTGPGGVHPRPAIASDGSGGAFLAWQDGRFGTPGLAETDLYVHHVLSAGTADPNWPTDGTRVSFDLKSNNTPGHDPAMLASGPGGAIVAWDGSPATLHLMNFNSTATVLVPLDVKALPSVGGSVTRSHVGVSYAQGSMVTLTATPAANYGFVGWSGDASGNQNPLTITMTSAKTINANFVTYPVNMTISPSGTGTVTKNPDQPSYAPGTQLTLSASGSYPFLGWSGDASGTTNPLVITVDGPKNITASFEAYSLTMVISPTSGGSVTPNPNLTLYPPGPVTLTALPSSGYSFSQWTGDASGSANPVQITMDGNKSVTANFSLIPSSCGNWTLASPTSPGGGSAWDPVGERVLTFVSGFQAPASLWQFTIAGGWAQATTGGSAPISRYASHLVLDSQRNRMLAFGGDSKLGADNVVQVLGLDETPTWSGTLPAVGTPPVRIEFTAIYDPVGDRVIRFAGRGSGGPSVNDVWQLSLSGTPTWSQIFPSGNQPSARTGHTAIYDPVRQRMIIFGGFANSGFQADTWALSLSGTPTWSQISVPNPPPGLYFSAAVYDPIRDRMALLAGAGVLGVDTDKTWFLSLATQPFWSVLPPGPVSVGTRYKHQAIYDPSNDLILAVGGEPGTGWASDTRRLDCGGGLWLQTGAYNGMVQVIPEKVCYDSGEHVTLVASPANGNMFDQWLGDASGSANPLDVTMVANKTIFAQIIERTTGVVESPVAFGLRVSPNPSAGPVAIEYALPREDHVRVRVFDVSGREVSRLVDETRSAGRHFATWGAASSGRSVPAGVYLLSYETSELSTTRRVVIVR